MPVPVPSSVLAAVDALALNPRPPRPARWGRGLAALGGLLLLQTLACLGLYECGRPDVQHVVFERDLDGIVLPTVGGRLFEYDGRGRRARLIEPHGGEVRALDVAYPVLARTGVVAGWVTADGRGRLEQGSSLSLPDAWPAIDEETIVWVHEGCVFRVDARLMMWACRDRALGHGQRELIDGAPPESAPPADWVGELRHVSAAGLPPPLDRDGSELRARETIAWRGDFLLVGSGSFDPRDEHLGPGVPEDESCEVRASGRAVSARRAGGPWRRVATAGWAYSLEGGWYGGVSATRVGDVLAIVADQERLIVARAPECDPVPAIGAPATPTMREP